MAFPWFNVHPQDPFDHGWKRDVLRSFYDEENLGSDITEVVRRAFRLPRF